MTHAAWGVLAFSLSMAAAALAAEPPADPRPVPKLGLAGEEPPRDAVAMRDPVYAHRTAEGRRRSIGGAGGTTREAEAAVEAGLRWLAQAQDPDGHWSTERWEGKGNHDLGLTGLALLAFLGAGYTQLDAPPGPIEDAAGPPAREGSAPRNGAFGTAVDRGLRWLVSQQQEDGKFAFRTFYEQGMATMALCEAYGLTQSPQFGRAAQRAVDFLVREQPEHGGFRYAGGVPLAEGDLSVTGWQIMALCQGTFAGLCVPRHAIERCQVFLKNSYAGEGKSKYTVGANTPGSPAMWAAGMCCRQFVGGDYDTEVRAAANALLAQAKAAEPAPAEFRLLGENLYLTYYSCLAMYQMGGEYWVRWNRLFRDPLIGAQVQREKDEQGRSVRGSWEPAKDAFGRGAGRVYTTAMAVLCLEVYYRYAPIYKTGELKPASDRRLPESGSF
jgi:hypothetical protein